MKRKAIFMIIASIIGALVIGLCGFLFFVSYGGNSCDMPPAMACDCFCCHMFASRGYEACGAFGFWAGIPAGASIGVLAVQLFWRHLPKD